MNFELNKEQKDIVKAAREFAQGQMREYALEWDKEERTPLAVRRSALELGFVGMMLPEEMGGPGLGFIEECLVIEEFSAVSAGSARAVLEPGWGGEFFLSSEHIEMGRRVTEGRLVLGLVSPIQPNIQGNKFSDQRAGFVLSDADLLLVPSKRRDVDGFYLLPTEINEVELAPLGSKLGLRSWPGATVVVRGLEMEGLDFIPYKNSETRTVTGKAIRTAAMALGIARGICERTLRHVQNRRLFGQSLSDFEATQFKFFSFWREMEAGRLMALRAAFDWDRGVEAFRVALAALVHNLKVVQDVTDEAVQLHGGYSYFEEMGVAMTYRDAKMLLMIWDDSFKFMKHLWPQLANIGAWRI